MFSSLADSHTWGVAVWYGPVNSLNSMLRSVGFCRLLFGGLEQICSLGALGSLSLGCGSDGLKLTFGVAVRKVVGRLTVERHTYWGRNALVRHR